MTETKENTENKITLPPPCLDSEPEDHQPDDDTASKARNDLLEIAELYPHESGDDAVLNAAKAFAAALHERVSCGKPMDEQDGRRDAIKFCRGYPVKFPLGDGTYQECEFIGVDSEGVATVKTKGGRYRTVWECNLYPGDKSV